MSLERDKKTLVISIGDSWTFGDSLGNIVTRDDCEVDINEYNQYPDDFQARFTQCYGRVIADALDADWYNFGHCGGGNISILTVAFDWLLNHHTPLLTQESYATIKDDSWPDWVIDGLADPNIYNELKEIHCKSQWNTNQVNLNKYDKVYVFITLTEIGRDYYNAKARNFPMPLKVEDYIHFEESWVYDLIQNLKKNSKYPIIVGRNFTVDLPTTTNSMLDVDKSWIEINYRHNELTSHNGNIELKEILNGGPVSGIGLAFTTKSEFENSKEFFVKQVNSIDKCWRWLRNNPMHYNKATCHPTKESHRLWAEYLLSYVK